MLASNKEEFNNCAMDTTETEGVRESDEELEFISRKGTTNYGHEYEMNMTALFTLRLLLNEGVRDVLVASNAEGYGAFDDVIIRVEYYEKDPELYAIQLKHKLKLKEGARIRTNDFDKKKGELFLRKYKESYEAIVNRLGDESDVLLKNISSRNVTLCLFTNAKIVDYNVFPLESSLLSCRLTFNSTQDFIDTNPNEFYKFQVNTPRAEIPHYFAEILLGSFYPEISKSVPKIAGEPGCEEIVNFFQTQLLKMQGQVSCETGIETVFDRTKSRYPRETALVKYTENYFKQLLKTASDTFSSPQFMGNSDYVQFVQERFEKDFDDEENDIRHSSATLFERFTKEELKSLAFEFSKGVRNPNLSNDRPKNDLLRDVFEHLEAHAQYKFKLKKESEYSSFFRCFQFYDRQVNHKEAVEKIGDLLRNSFGEDRNRTEIAKQFIDFVKAHFEEEISKGETIDGKGTPLIRGKLLNKRITKLKLLELLLGRSIDPKRLDAKYDAVFKDITNLEVYSQRFSVLEQIKVSLQGRCPLSLSDLAERSFHETIPTEFLLGNINEVLYVGFNANKKKPDFYIRRSFHKILLTLKFLTETSMNIFVFDEVLPNYLNLALTVLNKPSVKDLIPFCYSGRNLAIVVDTKDLITTVEEIVDHQSLRSFNVHHLKVCTARCVEWRRSWRSVKSLSRYFVDEDEDEREIEEDENEEEEDEREIEEDESEEEEDDSSDENESDDLSEEDSEKEEPISGTSKDELLENEKVDEEDVLEYFTNPLNIVSAIGGMGKTTMLKVLSGYCQPNKLALILDLKCHERALLDETSELRRNPLEYICSHMVSKRGDHDGDFEKRLFQHLLQERRLIIFIDAFDEVSTTHSEVALSIVEELGKTQAPIWIFTRPIALEYLNKRFPVIPLSMVELTEEDATCYLSQRLSATAEEVQDLPLTLLKAPLYLSIIAKTFNQLTDLRDLNIAELYERFTKTCFKEHMEKLNITAQAILKSYEHDYFKHHETAALLAFFDKEYLVDNKIVAGDVLEELVKYFEDCTYNFELVIVQVGGIPLFVHRTYAEYFLAVWIHKSLSKGKFRTIYEVILLREFQPVRLMFDGICSKGNQLLSAVLEKDLETVQKLCNGSPNSDACSTDVFGRSALHFAFSYLHQSNLEHFENDDSMRIAELLLGFLDSTEIVGRDELMGLDCLEYAERCGITNLTHVAAYWGALNVLKLALRGNAKELNRQTNFAITPLHAAAMNDQVECLRCLIQMGAEINLKDVHGNTPAHFAAEEGSTQALELLMENGAKVDEVNSEGWTTLHCASSEGHKETVTFLLEADANINSRDNEGQTPLHSAAYRGKSDVIKLLLPKGVNVNETDSERCTALHFAARNGYRNCAKLLTEGGADVDLQNEEDQTPLHCASKDGHLGVLKILAMKTRNVNETDASKNTALHLALINGQEECAAYLLRCGASNDLKNKKGKKPLHLAAAKGYVRVLKLLKVQNNIHERDSHGNTMLHLASWEGQKECVVYLVGEGADVNLKNDVNKQTPLHIAAHLVHLNVLEYLTEKIRDVDDRDSSGNTALHLAALYNRKESVISLIEAGAMVNSKNNCGQTPVHLAASIGLVDVLECLKERGADMNAIDSSGNTALHLLPFGITPFRKQCVFYLVKAGVDVNVKNKDGKVALHLAVYDLDLIKFLIENHANVNEIDANGMTTLHLHLNEWTSYRGSPTYKQIAFYLVAAGTDVNIKDIQGVAPIHLAARSEQVDIMKLLKQKDASVVNVACPNGNTPIHMVTWYYRVEDISFLVEDGADVNARNEEGMTPFLLAASQGYLDLLKFFRKNNLDEVNIKGNTALHLTVMYDHVECAKFLIEEGADTEAKNKDGDTPFDLAVRKQHNNDKLLSLLKEKRAGVNEIDLHDT